MFKNPIWYAIALKILRILLMTVGSSITTFLLTRKLIDPTQQATVLGILVDSAPAILGAVPGVWWDIVAWLSKFDWFVNFEKTMHLPVTGQPSSLALTTAQVAKINADALPAPIAAVSPSGTGVVPTPATAAYNSTLAGAQAGDSIPPMMKTLCLLTLATLALGLGGCAENSPFVAKTNSRPGDGKIPVSATVSATATGSTATNQPTDYTGGVAVTFGADVSQPDRQAVYDTAHAAGLTVSSLSTGPLGSGVKLAFGKAVDSIKRNDFLSRLYKKKAAGGGSFWAHLFGTDAAPDAYSPIADGPYSQPGSNLLP